MTRRIALALSIAAVGCGGGQEPALRARVDRLEQEVAALRARERPETRVAQTTCIDTTFPASTEFPFVVDFDLGRTNLKSGDRIEIKEVRGTRQRFEQGGTYLVRGSYSLGSADEATLLLSVTGESPAGRCTSGNARGRTTVAKGTGEFELAAPIPYQGKPHVTFYVGGQNGGGVYFGKDEFLAR